MRIRIGHIVLLAAMAVVAPQIVGGQVVEGSISDDKGIENEVRRLNAEEVQAFSHNDSKAMAHLWSDDFVVTNPLVLNFASPLRTSFSSALRPLRCLMITPLLSGSSYVLMTLKPRLWAYSLIRIL